MRRDDRDSIHDDRDRPRKSDSTVLVVVLAVAGALVLACGGLGALAFFGWTRAVPVEQRIEVDPVDPAAGGPTAKQLLSAPIDRKAVESAVLGASPDQVRERLGPPKQVVTMNVRPGEGIDDTRWVYGVRNPGPGEPKDFIVGFYMGRASQIIW